MTQPSRRVLYISHNHPSVRPGGAEQYALELYEAMTAEPGWEPILVAKAGPPLSSVQHHHVGTIFSRVGSDPNQLFAYTDSSAFNWLLGSTPDKELHTHHFRDLLLALRPDVVHFQHTLFFGYEMVRMVRRTLPEVPIVYTLHEFLPICHRNGQMLRVPDDTPCLEASPAHCHSCFPEISPQTFFMRKRLIQSHLEFVDQFIAPSQFLAERFVDWGIPRERILVEDYGRRGDLPEATPSDDRPVRDRFGYFGQLNPYKGVTVALEAIGLLRGADVPGRPHLSVYGANLDLQPGAFRKRFESLLDEAGGRATYAGAYVAGDVGTLMSGVDWVVVPSTWWENSPLVIQEAHAAGRPVICSDIGGMAEKVADGVSGLQFRVGDPDSLAAKMKLAIGTEGLWERLRAGIPPIHGMAGHIGVLRSVYEDLIGRDRRATRMLPAVEDAG